MTHLLAIDQGTTSSRAILFDRQGRIGGIAQREFRQSFPQPGWVEHDAEEIWSSQLQVINEVLEEASVDPASIAAVGITNQRETTVVWNRRSGRPIAPAIVWQDRRTAPACDRLREAGHASLVAAKTGLVIDAYFSASKIAWILDNVDGARQAAEAGDLAFGTIDSWLIWNLTGHRHHLTDPSNASRTMLLNIHSGQWDEELLQLFGIPRSMLPEICPSSGVLGEVSCQDTKLRAPIGGIAGDQQSALFGQICHQPGLAKNTYGTGCFLLLNTGRQAVSSKHQLLSTVAWKMNGQTEYALEGSVFIGGAAVQWLRDGLGLVESSSEVESLAASVADNGGVYLVPALSGLGAPHWDPYARGTICGLTRGSTRGHIARATLEGIAHQVADVLHAMEADASTRLRELRVDGGASSNELLMQFQADILGVPVIRPTIRETTALGAAYLAGLAVGTWSSAAELAENWQVDRRVEPQMPPREVSEHRERWAEALGRARNWSS